MIVWFNGCMFIRFIAVGWTRVMCFASCIVITLMKEIVEKCSKRIDCEVVGIWVMEEQCI